MRLLIATTNPNKLREIRPLLANLHIELVTLADIDAIPEPEENAHTFWENARIKALAYSGRSGLLTVADDSGLSVDALGGAPGLYSSRFGGEGASDLDRNRLLLEKLEHVPAAERGARFTSAVAVARGAEVLFEVEEHVVGRIAEEMRGPNGFGYDPLFFYPPYAATFGEVPRGEKDRVSHRGKAFARLRSFLAGLAQERA